MGTWLVIVLLSNQGYWVSGAEESVHVTPTLKLPAAVIAPGAELMWELSFASVRLATGRVKLDAGGEADLKIICPHVRVRVELQFNWRVETRDGRDLLAAGTSKIEAFPADLAATWPRLVVGRRVVVVDPVGSLTRSLGRSLVAAGVPVTQVPDTSILQLERADIVLVAPDALNGGLFEQTPLLALARAGAGVMIFRQSRVDQLLGLPLVTRSRPRRLDKVNDHALLAPFTADDLVQWLLGLPTELLALRLPPGHKATPLIQWPVEARGGASPATIIKGGSLKSAVHLPDRAGKPVSTSAGVSCDALLVTQTVGAGRVVYCQVPLGDWEQDARSRLFLGASLEYLVSTGGHSEPPVRTRPVHGCVGVTKLSMPPLILTPFGDRP